jgi:hypothetical protein
MKKFLLISISILSFNCNKTTPAGFWKNFDNSYITQNVNDQGPWGGHTVVYWKNLSKKYEAKEIVDFSFSNKWKLIKIDSLDNIAAEKWLEDHTGNNAADRELSKQYISDEKDIPSLNSNRAVLFTFDSHWVLVEGDTSKMAPGYVLLNSNGKQLIFYHKWGE